MWVKICSNYFFAVFSYGYLCWNCCFCNLLSFSRMQNSKECCLEYTEISISVFVIVFEWLKDSYFAEIVSLNQSHLGPNKRLRTCYFLEKEKCCVNLKLSLYKRHVAQIVLQEQIKLFFTSVNEDKQLINSLGKMWILLISFSTSDFVYLPKHEFNGQLVLTIYQDLNNGFKSHWRIFLEKLKQRFGK